MENSEAPQRVIIRKAQPADADVMLALIVALAEYEKIEPPDEPARHRLVRDAFSDKPRFEVLLAETAEHTAIGYAFILETYSSFKALPTLYLEDIFVLPEKRGAGAGFALFREVVREARRRGCSRVDFQVLRWNTLAQDFYARLGAVHLEDWWPYRLEAQQFDAVADASLRR
ncbi:MAG: GNAT family N-acetyltransferase [Candidatus Sumerlaeaceae bacterium]